MLQVEEEPVTLSLSGIRKLWLTHSDSGHEMTRRCIISFARRARLNVRVVTDASGLAVTKFAHDITSTWEATYLPYSLQVSYVFKGSTEGISS